MFANIRQVKLSDPDVSHVLDFSIPLLLFLLVHYPLLLSLLDAMATTKGHKTPDILCLECSLHTNVSYGIIFS